jgi:hypothetical protein
VDFESWVSDLRVPGGSARNGKKEKADTMPFFGASRNCRRPGDHKNASVIPHGDGKTRSRADIVVPAQAGTQFVPYETGFRLSPE